MHREELLEQYNNIKFQHLALDMSRGKPSTSQLNKLSSLLTEISENDDCYSENGIDCRNYGCLEGIPEAKKLFAGILGTKPDNVVVCGNSSLNIMFDTISNAYMFGLNGCEPWQKQEKIKFLCPAPGYDRHFAISEMFGMEMINIRINSDGPDMDDIERYITDETVKGIWCVPKYSNPTGITYSPEIVKRFAALKPRAKDFIVIWDDAYAVHDISEKHDYLLPILPEAEKQGSEDLFYIFTSTSKISWSGAGISCVAMSLANKERFLKIMSVKTIGFDKLAMLRHARMLNRSIDRIMRGHASIIRPKFELCIEYFTELQKDVPSFQFSKPNGGYFINVNVAEGKAKRIVALASEAGLKLTNAGATFPYGIDPKDSNIRIAPTYPDINELEKALKLFCICVKLAMTE